MMFEQIRTFSAASQQPIFFVSEELEREKARYYDLLNGVRGEKPDWYAWIKFFLEASLRMAENLLEKLHQCEALARRGASQLSTENEKRVWFYSFNAPQFTASDAASACDITPQTARKVLGKLGSLELIYTDKVTHRNKKYYNYEVLRILNQK
ncbi:MAG: hypothetical protein LBV19_08765 [Streptococcaceae bacterium]|jgi:Fic family protein|nr:hypothetical protein [Streptococcaceae bacterium]